MRRALPDAACQASADGFALCLERDALVLVEAGKSARQVLSFNIPGAMVPTFRGVRQDSLQRHLLFEGGIYSPSGIFSALNKAYRIHSSTAEGTLLATEVARGHLCPFSPDDLSSPSATCSPAPMAVHQWVSGAQQLSIDEENRLTFVSNGATIWQRDE